MKSGNSNYLLVDRMYRFKFTNLPGLHNKGLNHGEQARQTADPGGRGRCRPGRSFTRAAGATGMELVAICDTWEERLIAEGKTLNVRTHVDYDEFLGCDMDAVVLANYFHQHAPFAVKALTPENTS